MYDLLKCANIWHSVKGDKDPGRGTKGPGNPLPFEV